MRFIGVDVSHYYERIVCRTLSLKNQPNGRPAKYSRRLRRPGLDAASSRGASLSFPSGFASCRLHSRLDRTPCGSRSGAIRPFSAPHPPFAHLRQYGLHSHHEYPYHSRHPVIPHSAKNVQSHHASIILHRLVCPDIVAVALRRGHYLLPACSRPAGTLSVAPRPCRWVRQTIFFCAACQPLSYPILSSFERGSSHGYTAYIHHLAAAPSTRAGLSRVGGSVPVVVY